MECLEVSDPKYPKNSNFGPKILRQIFLAKDREKINITTLFRGTFLVHMQKSREGPLFFLTHFEVNDIWPADIHQSKHMT